MIRGPASHPQLLGNSSEQGTLSWMRTRNYASTPAKSSSLNWSPAKADSQNTILNGKIHYFYGKSPFLMGKTAILMGKSPFLMGKSTILMGKSPFLMGKSTILMGTSQFLMGKSTISMEKHDPQVMLMIFLTTSSCCQWQLNRYFQETSFQMFPCQRMSFWPSARIWQVSEAMSANMRTIIEPMVTGSARSRLGSVEHFTISLESRYQNQHAHSTGF